MTVFLPRYDFYRGKTVADKTSLIGFIHYVKIYGTATLYAHSDVLETLKAVFNSETGNNLIFEEIKNDNLLPDSTLNKYSARFNCPNLATVITDLV